MYKSDNYRMPGDKSEQEFLAEVIRVNHAGEYGAKRIYEGQLAALQDPLIQHMKEQEEVHLAYFEQEMIRHRVRPSILMPFWHVAGFALGYITAKMGRTSAMACTVAVEEVIDQHYQEQLQEFSSSQPELSNKIAQFRTEELEHKTTGLANHATEAPLYPLLTTLIKTGCKAAIWLAKRA